MHASARRALTGGAALLLGLLSAGVARAQLPAEWHGTWEGSCLTEGPGFAPQQFRMRLEIGPKDDKPKQIQWKSTFQAPGQEEQVKDFTLLETQWADRFVMKEPNGIQLDTVRVGQALYQQIFMPTEKVQLTIRFLRTKSAILSEIMSYTTGRPRAHEVPGMNPVVAFQLMNVQRCHLEAEGEPPPGGGPIFDGTITPLSD